MPSGARARFAERFALLYAEAGTPPLKQVAAAASRARRVDDRGRPVRVSVQRVSDWRLGRTVPVRFAVLAAVLDVLIGRARDSRPRAVVADLYDLASWHALWESALADPALATDPAPEALEDADIRPYPGLAPFGKDDAPWFFGRGQATGALLDLLAGTLTTGGMIALVGASGSGKSSLLRAGLQTALAEETPQLQAWPVLLMVPGADPVAELADRFPGMSPALDAALHATGQTELPDDLAAEIRTAVNARAGPNTRIVLIVDQFEETFTLCTDEARRRVFIQALHAACSAGGRALVVLGLRADFYGHCLRYPQLADALRERQQLLEPMTADQLREAILAPARAVGLRPEPGLAEIMLRDLGERCTDGTAGLEPGALPLLSHALLATWRRRHSGKLSVAAYLATGRIHGSVATTAERAWTRLRPDEQQAAHQLLLQLVRIGEEGHDTRRRMPSSDLAARAANGAATARALEVLAQQRLITVDAAGVEIAHEALLWAWPRLRRWINDDRAGNVARQRLEEDARTWERHGRDPSLLYRGTRLDTARLLTDVTPAARQFLADALRHQRRTQWGRRGAVTMVAVLAILAVGAAAVAVHQRDEATFRQVLAEADRMRTTDPSVWAQLSLVARRMRPTDMSVSTRLISTQHAPLQTPLYGHAGAVYLTSYSPDGRLLATASYDGTARLWDLRDPARPMPLGRPLAGHRSWVTSAVFSPDGDTLATAGDDQTVRLWDLSDPARPSPLGAPLTGPRGTIYLVAFSPDGRILATANEDHTTRLWNVADPAHPAPLGHPLGGHRAAIRSLAFSPDGRLLATAGDDKTIRLWDVTDPAKAKPRAAPLTGHHALVHSIDFSPDGRLLASGGKDKTIRLWDLSDPDHARPAGPPLTGHGGPVWSVKFHPDGRTLASGSVDSTTRLWNLADPAAAVQLGEPLTAQTGIVFAVAFSPDGRTLATGHADSSVRLWSMPSGVLTGHTASVVRVAFSRDGRTLASAGDDQRIGVWTALRSGRPAVRFLTAHAGLTYWAAFSPDGHTLATTGSDKTLRLWDVTDPTAPSALGKPITTRHRYAAPVAFSPDGRTLAAAGDDMEIRLWDIRDRHHPIMYGRPLSGHAGYVNSVAFSPDGHLIVTASSDKTARLWSVTDPASPRLVAKPLGGHSGPIQQASFSPDGRILATAGDDKTVQLWDVRHPERPAPLTSPLTGHSEAVSSVAFSPDGHTLATGSYDKTVRLWNVTGPARPEPLGEALTGHTAGVRSIAFQPGADTLATASTDGTIRLWDLDVNHAVRRICATTRGVLTPRQWRRHLPQTPYLSPCDS
ncbi:NACHT and WD repeat domain-containing protein [Nonomuraea endophytica]|uniref:WD40 repeat protein/energy-coupling factor transporter ATP-binding protein EcfA2 n=1 Tax=Nonomuraea endophytica TaxID=714136 RepID=A0A7W8A4I8_9ACTN|nr:AAA family ATPase [Nonomuraea endophytica]MBB5079471.1 WD40 repeat protein/energy-coupling factor transporter ATP-binding protein EcfA2 [Nonomuraea endophytica]